MSKLQGDKKIGELPEQRRLRQRMDEIIKEEIAETEHQDGYIAVEIPQRSEEENN